MTNNATNVVGLEINSRFVAALFTEQVERVLRVFCFYHNGDTSQFDMPAEENLGNLQHFLSRMNMEATCTSVIIDEVVQGRVYVRAKDHFWLYTLLSTPGNVLPPFNADIANLAWRVCWRSQQADILEFGKRGDTLHCFAVRSQIAERDALELVKNSRAFTHPVSQQKKQTHSWLCLNLGLVLALLGVCIGLTIFNSFKAGARFSAKPPVVAGLKEGPTATSYYLLSNHQISGPYPVKVLTDMYAGGLINAETMCRPDSSTVWTNVTGLLVTSTSK